MHTRYQRRHGGRSARKSAFGGTVKSHAEIQDLTKRIEAHEEAELDAFEENLDELFEAAENDPSAKQNLS